MLSFTYGDPGSLDAATIRMQKLPEGKYPMGLNKSDFRVVCDSLLLAWQNGNEQAGDLLSGIMTTLEIEWI